jgi:hypothetical protein
VKTITISDFFRINGIEKIVDQERILEMIGSRAPEAMWNHVRITPAQAALLGKVHGYRTEEPPLKEYRKTSLGG